VSVTGPSMCIDCGAPFAVYDGRCHLCNARTWCEANPVPLPKSARTLRELASIGHKCAAHALKLQPVKSGASQS
jgi:hypothetical protein